MLFGDDGDPLAQSQSDDLENDQIGDLDDPLDPDDGGEGDESGDLGDGEGGAPGDDDQRQGTEDLGRQQPRRTKEENLGALRRQLKQEAAKREKLELDLAEFARRQNQPDPRVAAEQEQARVALMEPEERLSYYRNKDREEFQGRLQGLEFRIADGNDQAAFTAKAASNKLYAAVQDEVETELQRARSAGVNLRREVIAQRIIGERAVKAAMRTGKKQKAAGQQRVDRQTARPTNPQGTQGQTNRRAVNDREARRKRLENVTF